MSCHSPYLVALLNSRLCFLYKTIVSAEKSMHSECSGWMWRVTMSGVNQAINWVTSSPYCKAIGMEVVMLDSERAVFSLPFQSKNANTTGALHGGVAASLGLCAGQAVARAAMGSESGPWHTVEFQINYLAAAMNETVEVEATVLRRGKDLCFLRIDVHGEGRKM